MSRFSSALVAIIALFALVGCGAKNGVVSDLPENNISKKYLSMQAKEEEPKVIKNNVSDEESIEAALFMTAIDHLDEKNHKVAAGYFEELFKKTGKKEYLIEAVKIRSTFGEYGEAATLLQEALLKSKDDTDLKKMLTANYIAQKDYAKALEIADAIAQKTKQKEDYDMAGSISYLLGDYKKASGYFRSSYAIRADDISADRIATILFLEGNDVEGMRFVETHIRMFGCSKYLCERLAGAYIQKGDTRGALEVFKKLYFKNKDEKYIKKIIELSVAGSDIDGLIAFLKKSKKDEKFLLEAYKYKKDNKNAAVVAMELYKKTNEIDYLAQSAIYKFESYPENKKPHWLITQTVKHLSLVVSKIKNDIYDNYLGYLLIDYDIDVDRGVGLVKRALEKEPNTVFYLDSLAWGYYKQKKCVEANEIMKKVVAEIKNDKTIDEHVMQIKKCLQGQK